MDANDELFRGNNYQKPNLVAVHVHQTAYKPPQHSTQYVNQPPQNAYYTPQPSTQYVNQPPQNAYYPPQHSTQYVNQPPQNAYYPPQPSTKYIYVPQPQNNNRRFYKAYQKSACCYC